MIVFLFLASTSFNDFAAFRQDICHLVINVFLIVIIANQVQLLILFEAKQHGMTLPWIYHHIVVMKPIK